MPIRKLPEFEGWTVDARLKQFRKVHEDGWIDFLDWDTDEGDEILARMIEQDVSMEPVEIVADTQASFYSSVKNAASPKIEVGGFAICCGWNSSGFGKNRGFEMIEILLVPHGGAHNDTIVTVEMKIQDQGRLL